MIFRRFSFSLRLFQKGPVQTSQLVKESVLVDYGSRDPNFGRQVEDIKSSILRFSKLDPKKFSCVLMQGPPLYICDSLFSTNKDNDELLVANNGYQAQEMVGIAKLMDKPYKEFKTAKKLEKGELITKINADTTHIALVHEESSGLLNPVSDICAAIKQRSPKVTTIVNGSQAYDWIYLDFSNISFYFSSFHNIIQAFNGISFCIANSEALEETKGKYSSLALDLEDQHSYQVKNPGQFRFTPPTHLIAAAYTGIHEWESEGINGRFTRLQQNKKMLISGLTQLGFKFAVESEDLGYSCISLYPPKHANWDLVRLSAMLNRKGIILNPQHMIPEDNTIQIGVTGDIHANDIKQFLESCVEAFEEMRIQVPFKNIY